jgi:hypothetical protein
MTARKAHTTTITFEAFEFPTAHEAIQHENASGLGRAFVMDAPDGRGGVSGRYFVATQHEIDRLAGVGKALAYLCDHEMPDGSHRIVTVPVNG